MNELTAFLAGCFALPGVLTSACALIIVPAIAWGVVTLAAPLLRAMDADPRWQAPLSAAAAVLPGALFVLIAAAALPDAWSSACLRTPVGRVLYGVVIAITVCGVLRALVFALRRRAEIASLLEASEPPATRELFAANRVGLPVRRVRSSDPFILLAGIRRPVVLVSTEAVDRLNDVQLEAAFRHEAAHAQHGDQLVAAIVTFVADLVPLPVVDLIAMYRRAREFAADRTASREADPYDLASALLALARSRVVPSHAAAFVEPATVRTRVLALVSDAPRSARRWHRIVVTTTLLATLLAGSAPTVVAFLIGIHCNGAT